ncbi:MAG: hypothetical protein PHE55_01135 [Methylococcaceae bacterium]|nr:hypothetical protein [Methylococcaceae bacterium]
MSKNNNYWFRLLMVFAILLHPDGVAADNGTFTYRHRGEDYPYSVRQTGDNYTFEFEKNPGIEGRKLLAALQVFQSVYGDDSIRPTYSETFMKEGATCFVFDASYYAYRVCFLPNDYSPAHRNRFWGFVSRVPNAMWLITRNLLPAALLLALFFFFTKRRR